MKLSSRALPIILVSAFAGLALWLIVLAPMGPRWEFLPGDQGDTRFNNYMLEHAHRWITGLDAHFWSARFLYPFPNATAFSDSLLGSAPIYTFFRLEGLDRESALQAWYVFGYLLNFIAALYVLSRLRLGLLARCGGALVFAFGLPVLAQEIQVQLLYRFGVPLACYYLWRLAEAPKPKQLVSMLFWLVWQFYLGLYTGLLLLLLLSVLFFTLPFALDRCSTIGFLKFWPQRAALAWRLAPPRSRLASALSIAALVGALLALLLPYWQTAVMYGFRRAWYEVSPMLPRWQSFLVADRALLWSAVSNQILGLQMRHEHQLFPGVAAVITATIGLWFLVRSKDHQSRGMIVANVCAAGLLTALTISKEGYSLYVLVWLLPGFHNIRAVSRISVVLIWPLSLLISWGLEGLVRSTPRPTVLRSSLAIFLTALLMAESVFFEHARFNKGEAQAALQALQRELPDQLPARPVLFLAARKGEPAWMQSLPMLLAQDLGWPTLNGYSSYYPPYYDPAMYPATTCSILPTRILAYVAFSSVTNAHGYYLEQMQRVVPVGFDDCDPRWWKNEPP